MDEENEETLGETELACFRQPWTDEIKRLVEAVETHMANGEMV
jgi:hypothetical protein